MTASDKTGEKPKKAKDRDERLAEALRANLRRRKAQERARDVSPSGAADPASKQDRDGG